MFRGTRDFSVEQCRLQVVPPSLEGFVQMFFFVCALGVHISYFHFETRLRGLRPESLAEDPLWDEGCREELRGFVKKQYESLEHAGASSGGQHGQHNVWEIYQSYFFHLTDRSIPSILGFPGASPWLWSPQTMWKVVRLCFSRCNCHRRNLCCGSWDSLCCEATSRFTICNRGGLASSHRPNAKRHRNSARGAAECVGLGCICRRLKPKRSEFKNAVKSAGCLFLLWYSPWSSSQSLLRFGTIDWGFRRK